MKRVLLIAVALLIVAPTLLLAIKPKKTHPAPAPAESIHWLTIDEIQQKMKENPRKVYIDIYTDWCGWCKKMDASTFTNPDLIKYMNNNFYCLKLNAERKDNFTFNGKEYHFEPQYKSNTLAVELLKGQMSYPTSVIMYENFQSPQAIPGYHNVDDMELYLSFFGDNVYKHQKYEDYKATFKGRWSHGVADNTPPPGH